MARALALAVRGLETTHPNPRVGCVIARGEEIVGEGWHERRGGPHAEVAALRAAGTRSIGATAYVTLEPCSHHGRTPPCAEALIAARVARVVFALQDPNPLVNGRGARALREAGIAVEGGLMAEEAAELNSGFIRRVRDGRPWVRLKIAASLDGRTALANGASQWITSEAARTDVQHWRARSSAVLVGVRTVLADDPRLDVRLPGRERQPLRVVLDSELRTPPDARLFAAAGEVLILAATDVDSEPDKAGEGRAAALTARGARIERVPRAARGLDLHAVLARLAALEVNELLVEAGPTLAGEMLERCLIDELLLYVAPCLLGPQARPLAHLPQLERLDDGPRFDIVEVSQTGPDLRLRLRPAWNLRGSE